MKDFEQLVRIFRLCSFKKV